MRFFSFFAVSFTFFILTVSTEQNDSLDENKVLSLTEETFDTTLTRFPLLLVKFYTPWCGYCQALAPEYQLAAEQLGSSDQWALAEVDCSVYEDLCIDHDVNSFPTLKLFKDGIPSLYEGQRQAKALVKYMQRQISPVVTVLNDGDDEEALATFIQSDEVVIVGIGNAQPNISSSSSNNISVNDGEQTAENKEEAVDYYLTFQKLAQESHDRYRFGWLSHQNTTKDELVVYQQVNNKQVYTGNLNDTEQIKAFIRQHATPLFDEINPDNYLDYEEAGLPLAYLFTDSDAVLASLRHALTSMAQRYRGIVNFVYIDALAHPEQAEYLGIDTSQHHDSMTEIDNNNNNDNSTAMSSSMWPVFVIQDPEGRRYIFPQGQPVNAAAVETHVEQFLQHKLAPFVASDPLPESNNASVKIVVGAQYNEIVTNAEQDVILEVYAPWCGHCKALAPVWAHLGELVQQQEYPLIVAKMDGTTNDIPPQDPAEFDVEGFPTIAFIEAHTHRIALYSGDRSVASLVDFIHEQKSTDQTQALRLRLSEDDLDHQRATNDDAIKNDDDEYVDIEKEEEIEKDTIVKNENHVHDEL